MSTYWTPTGRCWLAQFADTACAGQLQKAHLIAKQTIRREAWPLWGRRGRLTATEREELQLLLWDERVWTPACEFHHHALDVSRRLRVARAALPASVEDYAAEHGLGWWLDRTYGRHEVAA